MKSIVRTVAVLAALVAAVVVPAGTAMAAPATSPSVSAHTASVTARSGHQIKPADCETDGTDIWVYIGAVATPSGLSYLYQDEYGNIFPSPVYQGSWFITYCT